MTRTTCIFIFSTLLLTCNTANEKSNDGETAPGVKPSPPKVTFIADLPDSLKPETIHVNNTPEPKTFKIPSVTTSITINHKSKPQTLLLHPIEKTKTTLTPVLQNFTTEHGLALDVMSSAIADKKGNLWFGTTVNGVSKYDGHTFTNYSTAHGLPDNKITTIIEDRKGNIWIGTERGLSKFDGNTFSTLGNINHVLSVVEDLKGNLWIGADDGLFVYSQNTIRRYSEADGLPANKIYDLTVDKKGTVWIATEKGICNYNQKTFSRVPLTKEVVYSIYIDKKENLWIGNPDGYLKFDGSKITRYPDARGYFRHVYEDRLGNIWLSLNDGPWYTDGSPVLHKFDNSNSGAPYAEDKSGNLWFITSANGVIKYSGPALKKLTNNSLRSIFESHDGNIWFSGFTKGKSLTKMEGEDQLNFGFDFNLWCLFQDKSGATWMGASEGEALLIKLEHDSYTFYTDANGLSKGLIQFITQDSKGILWIGSESGLSKFDGKSFTHFTKKQGLAGNLVSCIVENKPGELLIGTDGGISIFNGKSFTNYSINTTVPGNDIRSIVKDRFGNLWIGTYGGGICRYDGKTFYPFSTEHGLPDNVVTQVITTKEGNIIAGTNNGVAVLKGFTNAAETKKHKTNNPVKDFSGSIPSSDGANDAARSLNSTLPYPVQNKLSNDALYKLIPVFEIYNPKTGYPIMDVNRGQHAMLEDSKGILWIASGSEKSGLIRFDYSSLYKNNIPPEINILSVKIDNENICWRDLIKSGKNNSPPKSKLEKLSIPSYITEEVTTFGKPLSTDQRKEMREKYEDLAFDDVSRFYSVPQKLKLPYSHNNITIEFAALEPDKPTLVQYQYMLQGYDKNWSTPANITSATFGNMDEGSYHFLLRARSPSGIWCNPITYSFTVLPPWWRTWWAYIIYIVFFLFVLRLFIKWREKKFKREKEKLEKTVELRTAEVVAEKKKSDELLLNILPDEVAAELKATGSASAKQFDVVTVMFTDFKGFTQISEKLTPSELVSLIDTCFKAFDKIIEKYNIEKIKTIGDAYMCAGGLPVANTTNAKDVVDAALEIQSYMFDHFKQQKSNGKESMEIRIGIHTGSVVAGIVGLKKFAYDIWGDTVNVASRLESSGESGKVNISSSTYELVKDHFKCSYRGKIMAKNKGEIDMYFVEGHI